MAILLWHTWVCMFKVTPQPFLFAGFSSLSQQRYCTCGLYLFFKFLTKLTIISTRFNLFSKQNYVLCHLYCHVFYTHTINWICSHSGYLCSSSDYKITSDFFSIWIMCLYILYKHILFKITILGHVRGEIFIVACAPAVSHDKKDPPFCLHRL